jgi:hypothetical protein
MLTLTSNTHILFGFVFLIGYSHQFENLIRKINESTIAAVLLILPVSQSLN